MTLPPFRMTFVRLAVLLVLTPTDRVNRYLAECEQYITTHIDPRDGQGV